MERSDLKIQFRAVYYVNDSHVLEYRVDPEQDLRYYKEHKWFWGLLKFRTVAKYSTKWIRPEYFWNHCTAKYYNEDDWNNWTHFTIRSKNELDFYKENFNTIGEFERYIEDRTNKEYAKWEIDRENYLKSKETMY